MIDLLVSEAEIETREGKRRWLCPGCHKPLGDITRQTIVIEDGERVIAIARPEHVQQRCPRRGCRASSYITMEVLAR